MNVVSLLGRLTKDPSITYTNGGLTIAKFNLAVDRRYKTEGGQTADFISVIAFGKTAEFIEKWFHKGDPITIVGRIQTGSYTNNAGDKVYTTDVVAEQVGFVPRSSAGTATQTAPPVINEGFIDVPDGSEEGLPFA